MYKLKDQFYTKPKIAEYCFKKFQEVAKNLGVNIKLITKFFDEQFSS
jgi:hypothetical protein